MEFSVRRPSPPNTYSYVREENLGSTRKSVEINLFFTCITNLILAIHTHSVGLSVILASKDKISKLTSHQKVFRPGTILLQVG